MTSFVLKHPLPTTDLLHQIPCADDRADEARVGGQNAMIVDFTMLAVWQRFADVPAG